MAEPAAEEIPTTRPVFLHLKHGEFDWMPSKEQIQDTRQRMKNYAGWKHVTGGKKTRWHAPDLEKDSDLYGHVANFMRPTIEQMLSKFHPDFEWEHVKYNALKTAATSGSQFKGHNGKLHSDYRDILRHLGPSDHPMSVIIALDEFNLYHLPSRDCNRKDMEFVKVGKGEVIAFKAECLHSGGERVSDREGFRLFAYVTQREDDIPKDEVQIYDFDSDGKVVEIERDSSKLKALLTRRLRRSPRTRGDYRATQQRPPKRQPSKAGRKKSLDSQKNVAAESQKSPGTRHKNSQKLPPTSQKGHNIECAESASEKQATKEASSRQSSGAKKGLDYCDDLRKQLEVLKQEHAANNETFNKARRAYRQSKLAIENLERRINDQENPTAKSSSVQPKFKWPHDMQCFYRPYCRRLASDCGGFHADKCIDFMPAKGGMPAGPRHHELPVGGIKSAEFKRRKRIHDSPRICECVDKARKKRKAKAAAEKGK